LITAVYPGTFDPPTLGHIDVATRTAKIFDQVIVGVYIRSNKYTMFSVEERLDMWMKSTAHLKNVSVVSFEGLLVDLAKESDAKVIIRGLRSGSDFEYESQMALMNKTLESDIETICLMTSITNQYISSSLVKQVAKLGGDVEQLVPPLVAKELKTKFKLET
tara:strand:+ start:94 stop:579 length:486 start_codon:yes stop_codon:yes gene_type:complete